MCPPRHREVERVVDRVRGGFSYRCKRYAIVAFSLFFLLPFLFTRLMFQSPVLHVVDDYFA